eukprot:1187685-Prorocentrum_minimum.AAC.2
MAGRAKNVFLALRLLSLFILSGVHSSMVHNDHLTDESAADRHRRRNPYLSGPAIVGKALKVKKRFDRTGNAGTPSASTETGDDLNTDSERGNAHDRARVLAEEGLPPVYRCANVFMRVSGEIL